MRALSLLLIICASFFTLRAGWASFGASAARGASFLIRASLVCDISAEIYHRNFYQDYSEQNGRKLKLVLANGVAPSEGVVNLVSVVAQKHALKKPVHIIVKDGAMPSMLTATDTCYLILGKEHVKSLNQIANRYKGFGREDFDHTHINDNQIIKEYFKASVFVIGHEVRHAKLTEEVGFSLAKGDEHAMRAVYSCAKLAAFHVLRARGFSFIPTYFSTFCIDVAGKAHEVKCAVKEEYQCDLLASRDPEILRAGARWFEEHSDSEIQFLAEMSPYKIEEEKDHLKESSFYFEVVSRHPRSDERAKALYQKAAEVEKQQEKYCK